MGRQKGAGKTSFMTECLSMNRGIRFVTNDKALLSEKNEKSKNRVYGLPYPISVGEFVKNNNKKLSISLQDRVISGKYYYWPKEWVQIFDTQLSCDVALESIVYVDLCAARHSIEFTEIGKINRRKSLLSKFVYSFTDLVNPVWINMVLGIREGERNSLNQSSLLYKKWYSMSGTPNCNRFDELITELV